MSELIIKELIILDYNNQKANIFEFSPRANLITSDSNEAGKSSLIKSIYYTLGASVSTFPTGWRHRQYIFQIVTLINQKQVIIKRQDKIFTIQCDGEMKVFSTEKDFSEWFQEQLGMQMKLQTCRQKPYR